MDTILLPFQFPFMQQALVISALVAVPMALLSCFLVLKGWSLMGDAISHAVLPGVVLAYVAGLPLAVGEAAPAVLDHVFEFVAVVLHEALHRPGRRIAERADGVAFDAVGDVHQHLDVLVAPLARHDPLEHAIEPAGAFPAGRALATGLRHVEA